MEELKSTETLDREILEDARKKALRILKTAEETLTSQGRSWEKKTKETLETIRKIYAERIKKQEEEILARLPLDKRRLRSKISDGFIANAMTSFLHSIKREQLLSILEKDISEHLRASVIDEENIPMVTYSGLSLAEARNILKKDWTFIEDKIAREFPSIIINTENMKITASVETAAANLLKDKRAELAQALLGEGVLND